jgi:hypothetical protein
VLYSGSEMVARLVGGGGAAVVALVVVLVEGVVVVVDADVELDVSLSLPPQA